MPWAYSITFLTGLHGACQEALGSSYRHGGSDTVSTNRPWRGGHRDRHHPGRMHGSRGEAFANLHPDRFSLFRRVAVADVFSQ